MACFRTGIAVAAASLLAACTTGDGHDPAATCTALLAGDPEIETDLAEVGASVETYCDCYATNLDTLSEDEQASVLKVSQIIADIRSERSVDVETAAGLIADDAEDASAATYGVSEEEYEIAGQFVDGVRRAMRENDGQCAPVDMR